MSQQQQNSGRIPGVIAAIGKFLKGLKEYNLLELLKVLFAVFVFALRDLTGADRAWMLEPQKLLSAL